MSYQRRKKIVVKWCKNDVTIDVKHKYSPFICEMIWHRSLSISCLRGGLGYHIKKKFIGNRGGFEKWPLCEWLTLWTAAQAQHSVEVQFCESTVKCNFVPKYLGVSIDRSLTFEPLVTRIYANLKTKCNIIQKLAVISPGALQLQH